MQDAASLPSEATLKIVNVGDRAESAPVVGFLPTAQGGVSEHPACLRANPDGFVLAFLCAATTIFCSHAQRDQTVDVMNRRAFVVGLVVRSSRFGSSAAPRKRIVSRLPQTP